MTNLQVLMNVLLQVLVFGSTSYNDLQKTLQGVFENYNTNLVPVFNQSQPIEVHVQLVILGLLDVDEREQTVHTNSFFHITWTDNILSSRVLKAADDNNISFTADDSLAIPPKDIWLPDIVVYNSVEDIATDTELVVIFFPQNGSVHWYPGAQHKVSCGMDVRKYPFETQRCPYEILSWFLGSEKQLLIYDDKYFPHPNVSENGEWEILGGWIENSQYFTNFVLEIRRRPTVIVLHIIVPICLLSILGMFVFLLPVQTGEKLTLSVSVLLSFSVFIAMINDSLPKVATRVAYLEIFLCVQIVINVAMNMCTILVLHVYNRTGLLRIPRYCLMLKNRKTSNPKACDTEHETEQTERQRHAKEFEDKEEKPLVIITWVRVATLLDRVYFVLFFLANLTSICAYFASVFG